MRIALVPSTPHFEDHFSKVGCTPEDLANGVYMASWISQYALFLRDSGVRFEVVCPTRGRPRFLEGSLLDVRLVHSSRAGRVPTALARGPLRRRVEFESSRHLASALRAYDRIYIQEYATGRAQRLAREFGGSNAKVVAAFHGTSIAVVPPNERAVLAATGWRFTALTALESESVARVVGGAARVVTLPNPVGDAWFGAKAAQRRGLVWVGRVEDRAKGVFFALETFRYVLRRIGRPETLTIVGGGSDLSRAMKFVERDPVLAGHVRFLGMVTDTNRVRTEVSSAMLLLNTSYVEGFPISVVEALAAGTPVALRELPYVAELADRRGVFVLSRDDPSAAADQVIAALTSASVPDRDEVLRRFGRERFVEDFHGLWLE